MIEPTTTVIGGQPNDQRFDRADRLVSLEVAPNDSSRDIITWCDTNYTTISPWWEIDDTIYSQYYGPTNTYRYGLFCPIIDRFIALEKYDLEVLMRAALLLSSKATFYVVMFGQASQELEMDNRNCHLYTLSHKSYDYASYQTPVAMLADEMSDFKKEGWPIDYIDRKSQLLDLKAYTHFVIRVVHAMMLTDRLTNRFNHKFFLDLVQDDVDKLGTTGTVGKFKVKPDNSGIPKGLIHEVSQMLYTADSIEEGVRFLRKYDHAETLGASTRISHEYFRVMLGNKDKDDECPTLPDLNPDNVRQRDPVEDNGIVETREEVDSVDDTSGSDNMLRAAFDAQRNRDMTHYSSVRNQSPSDIEHHYQQVRQQKDKDRFSVADLDDNK